MMAAVLDDPLEDLEATRQLLATLAQDWLTFGRLRQELLSQHAPDPVVASPTERNVRDVVLKLLDPARPEQEVERVYVALTKALANHPEFAQHLFRHMALAGESAPPQDALQAMLKARDDIFARWNEFHTGMQRVGLTICQIRVDDLPSGTGFLVGDRYVLTAYHCVADLIENDLARAASHERLCVVFDNIAVPGKPASTYRTEVRAAPDWLMQHSPPDEKERFAPSPLLDLTEGCLDFALIRLAEPAGLMAPKHQSTPRNWLQLSELPPAPELQAQVLIAHHPGGADLRLSVGLFQDHAHGQKRVRYLAPAIVGSSGAPCFTIEWKPYALHNAGYAKVPVNQGVPLNLIWNAIGGAAALDTGSTEVQLLPAETAGGEPILGRRDIAETVLGMLAGTASPTAIVIAGAQGSGKTFTASLVRSLVIDHGHLAFALSAERFATDTPELFVDRLLQEIKGEEGAAAAPDMPDSRQRARWITRNLSEWVRSRVSGGGEGGAKQTVWVILDDCDKVRFTPETHDLIVALIGDELTEEGDALRLVLLGYEGSLASVPPERLWQTTLKLISADGAFPYMDYVLRSLSRPESAESVRANAESWVQSALEFGVDTIPKFVVALQRWAQKRRDAVAPGQGAGI